MTIQSHAWESTLLSLAYEAIHHASSVEKPYFNDQVLTKAYGHCESVTATHSRSFYLASSLLPAGKRQAVRALYAFCRVSDDIVDSAIPKGFVENAYQLDPLNSIGNSPHYEELSVEPCRAAADLSQWRQRILTDSPIENDLVAVAWTDARTRYQVPQRYVMQLIDGVARDLDQNSYETFEELAAYCYGVASTVGLMSMHIIGYAGNVAIPYAIKLGVALQLTNILRDIAEDYQGGRVYLPQGELGDFNLSNEAIRQGVKSGQVTSDWRAFMKYQIERNRRLYHEAAPGIKMLDPDGRFAIGAAAGLYRGILADIEANDYNIFTRRAHVPTYRKLSMLPSIWLQSR